MLLNHLPRESAYVQAVGGPLVRWGELEHLLAGIIDIVQVGNFYTQVLASNRHLKAEPKPPKPLPRPGVTTPGETPKRARRPYTQAEMKAVLDNWNEQPEVSDDGS